MKKTYIILPVCAAIAGLAGSAYAAPISYTTADNLIVTGTSDPVTMTADFVSKSADDTDILELVGQNGDTDPLAWGNFGVQIFNNQTSHAGDTANLGSFSPGTELIFELFVYDSGGHLLNTWYSGSDYTLNNDGLGILHDVHFDPQGTTYSGGIPTTTVGVEDEGLGGDYDYNDLVYSFTGVSTSTVPDVAGTMTLLGLGLTGLGAFGRRFRK